MDITLGYARLYDSTVAGHYYGAMRQVEERLELEESMDDAPPCGDRLLALLGALSAEALIGGP